MVAHCKCDFVRRQFRDAELAPRAPMSERDFTQPEIEDVRLEQVLFALSDPTRLAIARALADGAAHSPGDLAGDVPKSTMSHHLKILREAGITCTRPEGMRCRVSLRRTELNRRFPGLMAAILKNADIT